MYKLSQNNRGVTLVEILAVVVLLSIIVVIINGVHLYGQKQFIKQNEQIEHHQTLQYALKDITKEIRRNGKFDVVDATTLSIGNGNIVYKFKKRENTIYKNNLPFISEIGEFELTKIEHNGAKLKVRSLEGSQRKSEVITTEIYPRTGDDTDEK